MNYNQYNSNFNNQVPPYPQPNMDYREVEQTAVAGGNSILDMKDSENSFVNAVLKRAIGKEAVYYFSYPDSIKWRDMAYEGVLEMVGEDYIVIRELNTNYIHVLLMLYLEYVVFKKEYEQIKKNKGVQ